MKYLSWCSAQGFESNAGTLVRDKYIPIGSRSEYTHTSIISAGPKGGSFCQGSKDSFQNWKKPVFYHFWRFFPFLVQFSTHFLIFSLVFIGSPFILCKLGEVLFSLPDVCVYPKSNGACLHFLAHRYYQVSNSLCWFLIQTITDEDHEKNLQVVEEYFRKVANKQRDDGECWDYIRRKLQSCLKQATEHCNNFGV